MNPSLLKMARTDSILLLTGRTGTGKSHLAREIHDASARRAGKFVAINLATLSENLIESELFGHERGAFSGADIRRTGKLESANGGTVFLDEIGELPPRLQTKLLEALNSLTISPVGSNREIALNVRIITATNRDLAQMVQEGTFREDLYFRINTFEIHLPDLAAEPSRILPLAENFARGAAKIQQREFSSFTPELEAALEAYTWPGNVRELKNAMEFAVAMSNSGDIGADCLPPFVKLAKKANVRVPFAVSYPTDFREAKCHFERTYLEEILLRFDGRINLTAKRSGLSKVTLIDKIRRYDIDIPTIKYKAHIAATSQVTL